MIRYWASRDEEGNPDGLFRLLLDDEARTATFERFDGSAWVDDPDALTETREPGVTLIDGQEAAQIEQDLRDSGEAADAVVQQDAEADAVAP